MRYMIISEEGFWGDDKVTKYRILDMVTGEKSFSWYTTYEVAAEMLRRKVSR